MGFKSMALGQFENCMLLAQQSHTHTHTHTHTQTLTHTLTKNLAADKTDPFPLHLFGADQSVTRWGVA